VKWPRGKHQNFGETLWLLQFIATEAADRFPHEVFYAFSAQPRIAFRAGDRCRGRLAELALFIDHDQVDVFLRSFDFAAGLSAFVSKWCELNAIGVLSLYTIALQIEEDFCDW